LEFRLGGTEPAVQLGRGGAIATYTYAKMPLQYKG